jgi:hypothetical protein
MQHHIPERTETSRKFFYFERGAEIGSIGKPKCLGECVE